jgi:hypothetical protein
VRHPARLPGEEIADTCLDWMKCQAKTASGAALVSERADNLLGFVAGWIGQSNNLAEMAGSNCFDYISEICVLPAFAGAVDRSSLSGRDRAVLPSRGRPTIATNSLAVNTSAQGTYEQDGFRPHEILYEKVVDEGWRP